MIQHPRQDPTQRNSRHLRSMAHGTLGASVQSARPYRPKRRGVYEPAPSPAALFDFDASTLGLSASDPVLAVTDQSGNGFDLISQGYGTAPTFDGEGIAWSTTHLLYWYDDTAGKTLGEVTVYAVVDIPASGYLPLFGISGGGLVYEQNIDNGKPDVFAAPDGYAKLTGAVSGKKLIVATRSATGVSIEIDGGEKVTDAATLATVNLYELIINGDDGSVTYQLVGYPLASDADDAAIRAGLRAKWGL